MRSDQTSTVIGPVSRASQDVRWVIPPLVTGRKAQATVTAAPGLPCGARLGEHAVVGSRGQDGACELLVVTHAERGSLHMARVVRREHAALGPAMLAAARRIQRHPQRNLLAILECGWTDEPTPRAFVVHDRVVGRCLESLLAGRGGIEWPQVLAIGLQCAEALEALHGIGLAHTGLTPASAALVLVAGDQFRVVLGGLDHAQTIAPGASASEEPRVQDDLLALGRLLTALAASSEASGSRAPEMLSGLLARMIDPRPAIRPASAGELHDLLAAVRDHVDPDLSAAHMLGETFRRICSDDFEVSIEADEPSSLVASEPQPVAPPRTRGDGWRRLSLLLVGLVVVLAGASQRELLRPEPLAAPTARQGDADDVDDADDGHGLARLGWRRIPELPRPVDVPVVQLPRCDDRSSHRRARPPRSPVAAPLLDRSPVAEPLADDASSEPVLVDASSEPPEEADLLPIPIRGAALANAGVSVLARRTP